MAGDIVLMATGPVGQPIVGRSINNKSTQWEDAHGLLFAKLWVHVGNHKEPYQRDFLSFGKHDAIAIVEGPDNVAVAAVSMMTASSETFSHLETTPLMTIEEAIKAMKKAGKASKSDRPPGR